MGIYLILEFFIFPYWDFKEDDDDDYDSGD